MADSLLAYLAPKLTSRVEDTATDALAFILNRSEACLGALDRLLRDQDFRMEPITAVRTQVTYEDGSRPDMAGYDRSGAKRLLVEAKFWAGLLLGQADGYFGQLDEAGPGVLLFIAPDSRIDTLWAEIRRQMETSEKGIRLEIIETGDRTRRAGIVGSEKQLMLVSWALLLDALAVAASGDAKVSSDILQLRGLAQREDQEAFLPIHRDDAVLHDAVFFEEAAEIVRGGAEREVAHVDSHAVGRSCRLGLGLEARLPPASAWSACSPCRHSGERSCRRR